MVGGIRKSFYKKKGTKAPAAKYASQGSSNRYRAVSSSRGMPVVLAGPPSRNAQAMGFQSGTPRVGEKKAVDIPVFNQTFSTTLAIKLISPIQTGTGRQNRVGSDVKYNALHFTGVIASQTSGNASNQDYARAMIIYDRQPTGTLPTAAEIFQDVDEAGAATNTATCGINLNNRRRFRILYSERYTLPAVSATGVVSNFTPDPFDNNNQMKIDSYINLSGLCAEFKSSSNPITIADITTGAIYCLTLALGTIAANANWLQSCKARLTYYDA